MQTAKMKHYGGRYGGRCVCIISDHPHFEDGTEVSTSKVQSIEEEVMTTMNTEYDFSELSDAEKEVLIRDFA